MVVREGKWWAQGGKGGLRGLGCADLWGRSDLGRGHITDKGPEAKHAWHKRRCLRMLVWLRRRGQRGAGRETVEDSGGHVKMAG